MRGFMRVINENETVQIHYRYRWVNGEYYRQVVDTCYPNIWQRWNGCAWCNLIPTDSQRMELAQAA